MRRPVLASRSTPQEPKLEFTELPGGGGYLVTIPFRSVRVPQDKVVALGRTVLVGWRSPKPVPRPKVRSYTVTVEKIIVRHRPSKEWSFYGYVNEDGDNLTGGSKRSSLHEPILIVDSDQTAITGPWVKHAFEVTLVDGQPLHIQFRATVHGTQLLGFQDNLAGIAENILPPDDTTWTTHHSGGSICARGSGKVVVRCETPSFPFMAAGPEEREKMGELCHGPTCYVVVYEVARG